MIKYNFKKIDKTLITDTLEKHKKIFHFGDKSAQKYRTEPE